MILASVFFFNCTTMQLEFRLSLVTQNIPEQGTGHICDCLGHDA